MKVGRYLNARPVSLIFDQQVACKPKSCTETRDTKFMPATGIFWSSRYERTSAVPRSIQVTMRSRKRTRLRRLLHQTRPDAHAMIS